MARTPVLKFAALWRQDCQGKKDYDGFVLSISSRYWPGGGGFHVLTNDGIHGPKFELSTDPSIKPSAHSALCLRYGPLDADEEDHLYAGNYLEIASKEFTGDSFEDVSSQVEHWAQRQMDKVVRALSTEFEIKVKEEL